MAGGETTWIIANWKSNKTLSEALEWVDVIGPQIPKLPNLKVVVCSDFICVEEVKKRIQVSNYPLLVGVQDLSPYEVGPYTGEEAAKLLQDLVDLAILGHSERRVNFKETDQLVAQKVNEAKKYNIIPLVCLQDESTPVPEGVSLVAYEPIEAIGTSHPDTPQNAAQVAKVVKEKVGQYLEVLYGGSVTSANSQDFLRQDSLSGLLIGGASLDANEFAKIINSYGDLTC